MHGLAVVSQRRTKSKGAGDNGKCPLSCFRWRRSFSLQNFLNRKSHPAFCVRFELANVQEGSRAQGFGGEGDGLQQLGRRQDLAFQPGTNEGNALPAWMGLCQPQEVQHPGFIKHDGAEYEVEIFSAKTLFRLRQRGYTSDRVAREEMLDRRARIWRGSDQYSGHRLSKCSFILSTP